MERRSNYTELLEELKTFFPAPVSSPIMDGYFIHTVSHFLDNLDQRKSSAPILSAKGETRPRPSRFPEKMSSVEEVTDEITDYCQGMMVWAHPNAQLNVVPPTTIPSITATIASSIYNPNMVWDAYTGRFIEAEIDAVALLCDLVGYDPKTSGGLFTFGGTGTILYGCKIGIEKILKGQGMRRGIREDFKVAASASAHYTKLNALGWLGIGTDNLVEVRSTRDNEMDLSDLEKTLRDAFERGEKVAVIIATIGTTDAFGIDDLSAIAHLRDRLAAEYDLDYRPHIHADAVIGWVWAVFRDYDFENNPMGFHSRTLAALQDSLRRIGDLSLADSLGIDLHKTGYAPYISSAFLIKDRNDLSLISRTTEQMPYLFQFGQYHPGRYTLECSRPGASALGAIANIKLFGKEGYRALIGHNVEMAEMLRERLEGHRWIKVLNDFNYGPVTLFRVYPDEVDAKEAFQRELNDPGYRDQLELHNMYNRCIFDAISERSMRGEGVLLSWTSGYRNAGYAPAGAAPVSALKSFIMSPWTDGKAIDTVERQIMETRTEAAGKCGLAPTSRVG